MIDDDEPAERETRADQILARFKKFHAANPQIWDLFQRYAFQMIEAGRTRYATECIINRVRWHVAIQTKGDDVKLNNDFKAYYARMFMAKYPQHAGFFELRKRLSAQRDAYDTDMPVWNTGPAGNESSLMDELRRL